MAAYAPAHARACARTALLGEEAGWCFPGNVLCTLPLHSALHTVPCAGLHVAQVIANMMDCETVYVETATGPGGLAGPLRVDIKGAHCSNPLQVGYTLVGVRMCGMAGAGRHMRVW